MMHERKGILVLVKGEGAQAQMEGLATDGQRECRAAGMLVALVVGRSGSRSDCTYFLYEGQSEVRLRVKEEGVLKIFKERRKYDIVALCRGRGMF